MGAAAAGAGILDGVRVHHGGNEGDPGGNHANQKRTSADFTFLESKD